MRRSLLIFAALGVLAGPAAAALAAQRDAGDGTLAVRKASGDTLLQPVVGLAISGAVVGHITTGRLVVLPSTTGPDPSVTADRTVDRADGSTVYSGTDISFKAVGGYYRLRVTGVGIDLNAVGQGKAWLLGSPTDTPGDGSFSLNGASWKSMPDTMTQLTIGS